MKFLIIIPTAIMMTVSANAETVWVKTPFWQTAYARSQTAKIKADTNLDETCEEYSLMVFSGSGRTALSAQEVETLRSYTGQMNGAQYNATFTVDRALSERFFAQSLRDVAPEIAATAGQDVLPHYSVQPAEINPLDKILSPIQIGFVPDSLSRVSQALGLRPLKIEVAAYVPQTKIRVYGRDSACDLYRGKASLEAPSTGPVKISLEQQLKLSDFYQAFEELTESAFARTQKPLGRMAVLGYGLAPVLAPLRIQPAKAADLVETLVTDFFNVQGERNENWTVFNGKPHLSVSGAIPVQFQLKLER